MRLGRFEVLLLTAGIAAAAASFGVGGTLYAQTLPPRTSLPVVNRIDSSVLVATRNSFVSLKDASAKKTEPSPPPGSAIIGEQAGTTDVLVLCSTDTTGTPEAMFLVGNNLAFGTRDAWIAGYRIRSINDGSVTMYDGSMLYQSQCGNAAQDSYGTVIPPAPGAPSATTQNAPPTGTVPNPQPTYSPQVPQVSQPTTAPAQNNRDLNTVYGQPAPTSAPYYYPPNPRSTPR